MAVEAVDVFEIDYLFERSDRTASGG